LLARVSQEAERSGVPFETCAAFRRIIDAGILQPASIADEFFPRPQSEQYDRPIAAQDLQPEMIIKRADPANVIGPFDAALCRSLG
jgi:hypothetical protein